MNSPKVKIANRRRRREKLQRQAEEMAELRAKVFARAGGKGELCGLGGPPTDLCHLSGGIGRRRQQQSEENCIADHKFCHNLLDSNPLAFLGDVKAHCARYGYPLPERFRILEAKQIQQKGVTNG
jgi:hypothetical protein